jgi:hypothetical protein
MNRQMSSKSRYTPGKMYGPRVTIKWKYSRVRRESTNKKVRTRLFKDSLGQASLALTEYLARFNFDHIFFIAASGRNGSSSLGKDIDNFDVRSELEYGNCPP